MLTSKPRLPIKQILLYGLLPSPIKKFVYRMLGYRIGEGVSLALGSVICGKEVEIGKRSTVGFFTVIRGEKILVGDDVQIGAATFLDTPHIEIGDGTKINEQVFVGGLQFPDAKLIVGRNCQIMQMTFINPTRTIRVGDDTGIGGDCLIFGHSSWLSKFEGYPVEFDSIEIGSNVSLAWRVFVLPGAKIGDGAVVGANSLVRGEIPPRCLAVGFPARVVSRPGEFPKAVSEAEKAAILKEIVDELIEHFQAAGFACHRSGTQLVVHESRRRWLGARERVWKCEIAEERMADSQSWDGDIVLSLFHIPDITRRELVHRGIMWIDIEKKERSDAGNDFGEEIAQYLKRYGVRLFRAKESGAPN